MKKSDQAICRISYLLIMTLFLGMHSKSDPIALDFNISKPSQSENLIPLQFYVPNKNKSLTIGFPDINFQISSSFYTRGETLDQSVIFKKESYPESFTLNQFCDIYPTSVTTDTKVRLKYKDNVQNLKYTVYHRKGQQGSLFYMLGSDSKLYVYGFNKDLMSLEATYEVSYSISQIKQEQLQNNIQLLVINGQLLLANKYGLYIFDKENKDNNYFIKVEGYEPMQKFVDFGLAQISPSDQDLNGSKIWVCKQKNIVTYQIRGVGLNISLAKVKDLQAGMDTITAVTYDFDIQSFHIVSGHILSTIERVSQQRDSQFTLQGICTHITKIKATLYLGCRYHRRDFIAQIRVQNGGANMVLNRFYDDSVIEGVRDVQYLGFDKIAVIGDEQSLIISQAVNRNTLLDLSDRKTRQVFSYVFSFGMIDLFYLPQFSTPQHSAIFVVGETSISLHTLIYEPPQLQCNFHQGPHPPVVSALVVFNITHCPFPVQDEFEKSGTFTQCQVFYPLRIEFQKKQYEQKTANFIFFVLMLLLIVGVLLCAGFGVKIRNKANAIIGSMKTKLEKIKIAHQNSEMKKL